MGELKERITYSEFLEWIEYINWDERRLTKLDHYLAQIAAEIRRGLVKQPHSVKLRDFLLTFSEEAEPSARALSSKTAWMAALNMKSPDQD